MPDPQLRFDGRVVVVTGGGRGIGLAYCRVLAARGASVVVNDLGAEMDGAGTDERPAYEAVREIVRGGGRAEPDTSDVSTEEGARSLVQHALDAYGRVDALVHNAGNFATDRFPAVETDAFERQLAVHVAGGLHTARAAWPHLAEHGRGRIVLTSSSGALGSANLAAYGTAKMGVVGLGRSLAVSGRDLGIKVNVVAPMAMTRMMVAGMAGSPAENATDDRNPVLVAALVALLCHDRCPTTGEFFNAGMHRYSRFAIVESDGYLHPGGPVEPEDVLHNWDEVMDVSGAEVVPDTLTWGVRHFARLDRQRGRTSAP